MKVIFLDHQGVMYLKENTKPGMLSNFDHECVTALNEILNKTNAEIVISSDWKYWVKIEEMQKFYLDQGIIKSPISYTQTSNCRSNEILIWLDNNTSVSKWIAIDDMDMRSLKNFIWITNSNGIKDVVDDCIKLLL